jgi:hypothetical protein
MQDETDETIRQGLGWQAMRFVLHLCAVYLLVQFSAGRLAGWTHKFLLPAIQVHTRSSRPEFFYNHLLFFSSLPAFASGLANARFKHTVAQFVWAVPTAVLAYKLITFPIQASVLASHSWPAFHYYLGGGFSIPDFYSWSEFARMVAANPDLMRGAEQVLFTAPFYAAVAYSLGATLGLRMEFLRRGLERVRESENRAAKERVPEETGVTGTTLNELPPA